MAKGDKKQQEQPEETPGTAVATQPPQAGAVDASQYQYDAEDLGGGFEGTTSEDFLIPFLGPVQKTHPFTEEDNPAYIQGAKPGMVFNSVTMEMFDGKEKGIVFIPVHREHSFIEWIPRDQGGGFVGKFEPTDPLVQEAKAAATEFGDYKTPSDNDLRETFTVYGLLLDDDGGFLPCAISFASTQIKNYKRWMTQAMAVQIPAPGGGKIAAPLWSHKYRLRTQFNENASGTWYGWLIGFDGGTASAARIPQEHYLYQEAKKLRKQILSGVVKADMTSAVNTSAAGAAEFGDTTEM